MTSLSSNRTPGDWPTLPVVRPSPPKRVRLPAGFWLAAGTIATGFATWFWIWGR